MPFCARCGAEHTDTDSFCTTCGTALGSDSTRPVQAGAPTLPPPPRRPSPPPAPPSAPPSPPATKVLPPTPTTPPRAELTLAFDWRRLVVGNWYGAALTALSALLVTGVLAGVLGLMAKSEDLGVRNTLTLITLIATGAFGADLTAGLDFDLVDDHTSGSFSLGMFPLTVTLVALAVAFVVFRRVVSAYPAPGPAVLDAVRAALLFAVGLTVPALVFRTDNDELGRGWPRELSEDGLGGEAHVGASAVGAFFLGFLVMVVVLLLALFTRSGWWPDRVRRVQELVVAPLYGYATVLALLPVAGVLALISMGLFGEPTIEDTDPTGDTSAIVALLAGGIANGGLWVLGLGTGAKLGASYELRGSGEHESGGEWSRLWGDVTSDEPGLWIAPLLLLAVLFVAAYVVARRAPQPARQTNLLVWALGFLVVAPWLVRLAGLHARVRTEDSTGTYRGTFYVGISGLETTVFMTGIALAVALVVAAMTGGVGLTEARNRLRSLAGSVQSNPGKPPSEPGQD